MCFIPGTFKIALEKEKFFEEFSNSEDYVDSQLAKATKRKHPVSFNDVDFNEDVAFLDGKMFDL